MATVAKKEWFVGDKLDFSEMLKALKCGHIARRKMWCEGVYAYYSKEDGTFYLQTQGPKNIWNPNSMELLASDWEVFKSLGRTELEKTTLKWLERHGISIADYDDLTAVKLNGEFDLLELARLIASGCINIKNAVEILGK